MSKRVKFKAAVDPYFKEHGRGWLYKRNVPLDVAPLIGLTAWWVRLGEDKEATRRKAAMLRRDHDTTIARLRTSPVRNLVRRVDKVDRLVPHVFAQHAQVVAVVEAARHEVPVPDSHPSVAHDRPAPQSRQREKPDWCEGRVNEAVGTAKTISCVN